MPISTVRATIKKCKKLKTIMNQPRRGRKVILSAASVRRIIIEVKKSPKTTVSKLQSLVTSWGHPVSKSTIRHYPHAKQTVWKEHHWNFDSKRSKWVWRRNEDGYREKHLIPSVKYDGGSVIARVPVRT